MIYWQFIEYSYNLQKLRQLHNAKSDIKIHTTDRTVVSLTYAQRQLQRMSNDPIFEGPAPEIRYQNSGQDGRCLDPKRPSLFSPYLVRSVL
jgi:hypothetical protein